MSPNELMTTLRTMLGHFPAFAIGFIILAMFWHEHVAWRDLGGNNQPAAVVLSLLLVFTVLVFVLALRPMAEAFASFLLTGSTPGLDERDIAELFRIYGAAFAAMCSVTMALHLQGRPHGKHPRGLRGRAIIYGILATAGTLSILLTLAPAIRALAPWVYPVAGICVGLFAALYRWAEAAGPPPEAPS